MSFLQLLHQRNDISYPCTRNHHYVGPGFLTKSKVEKLIQFLTNIMQEDKVFLLKAVIIITMNYLINLFFY